MQLEMELGHVLIDRLIHTEKLEKSDKQTYFMKPDAQISPSER